MKQLRVTSLYFCVTLLGGVLLSPAASASKGKAVFAVVVGVNKSVDKNLAALHYADDDAVKYSELFKLLGAKVYLLSRLDKATSRLYKRAVSAATTPRMADLKRIISIVKKDVAKARARKLKTELYFVYAGHGNVRDRGDGYISLEDERLTSKKIVNHVLAPVGADVAHMIVDACNSFFLAYGRGPGGRRRPVRGFSTQINARLGKNVGLLLSTSSARLSHEWERYQGGVFSHEVRSGLLGAADANSDGKVSYREIAAFVENAHRKIPNERFRSHVFARPPAQTKVLMNLLMRKRRRLTIPGRMNAHYYLEDRRGVRLADLHNGSGQDVYLLLLGSEPLFLFRRHGKSHTEHVVPNGQMVVALNSIKPEPPKARHRGAAEHAFNMLFHHPFDQKAVEHYRFPKPREQDTSLYWTHRVYGGFLLRGAALEETTLSYGASLKYRLLLSSGWQPTVQLSWTTTPGGENTGGYQDISLKGGVGYVIPVWRLLLRLEGVTGYEHMFQESKKGETFDSAAFSYCGQAGLELPLGPLMVSAAGSAGGRGFQLADGWVHRFDWQVFVGLGTHWGG